MKLSNLTILRGALGRTTINLNHGNVMNRSTLLSFVAPIFALAGCTVPETSGDGDNQQQVVVDDGNDTGGNVDTTPCAIAAIPSTVDFGNVAVGTTASQAITVNYTGAATCEQVDLTVTVTTGDTAWDVDSTAMSLIVGGEDSRWAHITPDASKQFTATVKFQDTTGLTAVSNLVGYGFVPETDPCDDGGTDCDNDGDGWTEDGGDCNDTDGDVNPGADEDCTNGQDDDCDGDIDGDDTDCACSDSDGDGACDADDECPGYDDGVDTDGDGVPNGCDACPTGAFTCDQDGDGFAPSDGDCDDTDINVYPGAAETAYDGVDQDCDGSDTTDVDGDGYDGIDTDGDPTNDDCDDTDPTVNPGAAERCTNGQDDDCDGNIDGADTDCACSDSDLDGVCDDDDACEGFNDGADTDLDMIPDGCDSESCDGLDNNGDGNVDEGLPDTDGDGLCDVMDSESCGDEIDNNGNGIVDEGCDDDGDGWTSDGGDCNDNDASVNPGATEVCNGFDDDCDTNIDDNSEWVDVYVDAGTGTCADGNGATVSSPGWSGTYLGCEDGHNERWYIACWSDDAEITEDSGRWFEDGCAEALATNPSWPASGVCGWLTLTDGEYPY